VNISFNSDIYPNIYEQAGHSILANVTDFFPYFYVPYPRGLTDGDLDSLRHYLNVSIDSEIAQAQYDNFVAQNQVGESENIVRKIERVTKKSLWGYRGDEWVPFLKLTVSTATNLPKVRDEYLFICLVTRRA
jgi:DNA polymerase delta subunit 1